MMSPLVGTLMGMKKWAPAVTVVALLALTGCAAGTPTETPAPDTTDTTAPAPAETPDTAATPDPDVTPGPVQVTPQAETPTDPTEGMTAEERYIYYADEWLQGWNVHLSEADLLSAGQYACEQFAAGVPMSDIVALEGVGSAVNEDVLMAADQYLCD